MVKKQSPSSRKPYVEQPKLKFAYKCKICGKIHPLGRTCKTENK